MANTPNPQKILKTTTIVLLSIIICWGMMMVLSTIKPFWIDEWRLIYNLKCKSATALLGPLDFTQQFPRAYLEVLKSFTSALNYSYFSLRLPSFVLSVATIFFCYRLMRTIYPSAQVNSFLFVLILVSSQTFTDYIVQMKQYEMEILLSLVAIWQLLQLLDIEDNGMPSAARYALLCFSFLVPFFSYTYPIAAVPIFIIMLMRSIRLIRNHGYTKATSQTLSLLWLPLVICMGSIFIFYLRDVSQLMADQNMHQYWQYRMKGSGTGIATLVTKFWDLFAQVGAGLIFQIIFGILGISAFFFGIYRCTEALKIRQYEKADWLRLYCILLLAVVIDLFLAGKLPVGEPKFNAFTVPAIAILIIFLLDTLAQQVKTKKLAAGVSIVLYIGLTGNIISTIVSTFTLPEYSRRMVIYDATENAIRLAQARNIPIIVTPGVAWPDDIVKVTPYLSNMPAACVLKTFPAYNAAQQLPVYTINDLSELPEYMKQLPPGITTVLAGDGISYKIVNR